MPKRLALLEIEVQPLDLEGEEASHYWVRATEILLRAKARRDAQQNREVDV